MVQSACRQYKKMQGTDFELLEGHIEHGVGVGHLFAADGAVVGEVGCR